MHLGVRHIQDICVLLAATACHAYLLERAWKGSGPRRRAWLVPALGTLFILATLGMLLGFATRYARFAGHIPEGPGRLAATAGLLWVTPLAGTVLVLAAWRAGGPRFNPERRKLLRVLRAATLAAPTAAVAYGAAVSRTRFELHEVDLRIPGLPRDLDGLRIVQLSDIHLGAFLSEAELARAVDMANEARPHVAVVTGDLITWRGDPLDACLRQVARLRAGAGIFGCHGNHEVIASLLGEATAKGARLGIRFLRQAHEDLRFGGSVLRLAGVDHQRMGSRYLVGAEALLERDPRTLNVLLSHNPDVLPTAAAQGFQVMLAGHTHGGQVNLEIFGEDLNVARFYTPYVKGLYRVGNTLGYVTRGIGTIGMPARIGARPEVAVLRLCAI